MKRTGGLRRGSSTLKRVQLRPDPETVRAFMERHRGRGFREREPIPPEVLSEAFARSGNKCLNCGKAARYLHPHHFLEVNPFPELQILADNIGALCSSCHMNHHFAPNGRIPWEKIPAVTIAMATREGNRALMFLERTYPRET